MPTLFTRIINGEIPGTFVWKDELCVAFLSINPIKPGHTLVVPVAEVGHWIDLDDNTSTHLMTVAKQIGTAIQAAWNPHRVGLIVAGYEVDHTHLHVIPTWSMQDLDFKNAALSVTRSDLEEAASLISARL